ncbi:uncharacterized protein BP5553_06098 [Venustampulla echinocandica]|uniref:Uncharacterized protein n=1 Tax=Venustampulla echinocandica TaxID=2656787 RepID=A0A370TMJ1_9HELO|nr:uncharacterized protein BP5553_06098 [Venustampulla echinocandica]RDL36746.1 hypothetical protein BP5553_06098 [Venustampulla echinocandica]
MTANQCRRPNLEPPKIYETFSLCSLRADAQLGDNRLLDAIERCCTTPIKGFQCWNYCEVEQSMFPTWLGCVQETLNSTWGTACQSADQSPILTETAPYPTSFTNPPPPLTMKTSDNAATNTSATSSSITGAKNATTSTFVISASPTDVKNSGSTKTLELSMGGIMCAFLVLSALAL